MKTRILYAVIDGEITGGNMICLKIIEEGLKRGYPAVVNSPTEGKFTDILREKGIKVYNIDTRRSFRFDSAIKLAGIINKEDINLMYSHTPLGGTILSRLGGWMAGVPVINHAHLPDNMNANPFVKRYQLLLNWLTSRFFCAKVIAVSESTKMDIIKQGIVANKIIVVYNGIDLDDGRYSKIPIEIRQEFGLGQNQRIIGEVARLCESKGQHILIKAAQKVIKEFPQTVFMIVGEDLERKGEYKKKLEDLASDLGLKQQIIFTGYRPDIMNLLNAFDLFVLPSLVEGLPVVILEAMAAKKPVIATSVGGNAEIVVDGKTGILVPPEDSDKLAKAIIYHLNNPEISKRMGEKGYEKVRQYFSLSEMLDKVMDIYKEVLEEK
jgi:glycosyltransferase involved in cell wall biosynthesis